MSEPSGPERSGGCSRREFVQGRFFRALGLGRQPKRGETETTTPSSRKPALGSLIMRYPKTLQDVAGPDGPAADVASHLGQASAPENAALEVAVSTRRRTIPVMRPPGAIDEEGFLQHCTRCGDCISACPHKAIVLAPSQLREAAGTPMIQPDHQPCLMCEDFPCITACSVDALTRRAGVMMGTAKITEHLCLAHHGTTCTVCSERCPVSGAITITAGKPSVHESACTGCGVCRYVCPAPENAILMMPAFRRPFVRPRDQA